MSLQTKPPRRRMSKVNTSATHQIYPAFAFSAAPTFQKWVKLTAADVHALRQEPLFEGQNIYFHLNHPIEFVYIIGPVVAIDHIVTAYNTRFSLLEIDDGSGATIEVKISYKQPPAAKVDQPNQSHTAQMEQQESAATDDDEESQSSNSDSSAKKTTSKNLQKANTTAHTQHIPTLKTDILQTTVQNLTVLSTPTSTDLMLHNAKPTAGQPRSTKITVGTVLKAKGTLQRFRGTMQLALRRIFLVPSPAEERAAWASYAEFVDRVLSRPWVLTAEELRRLEAQRAKEDAEERKRVVDRRAREVRRKDKVKEREARRERYERRVEARLLEEAAREDWDGNALDRVGWVPSRAPVPVPVSMRVAGAGEHLTVLDTPEGPGYGCGRVEAEAVWQHELESISR